MGRVLGNLLAALTFVLSLGTAVAQTVEVSDEPAPAATGAARAMGYFKDRKAAAPAPAAADSVGPTAGILGGPKPRFLAVHAGTFFTDQAYKWGKGGQANLGKVNVGVDYRVGEWVNAADFSLRVDFTSYELDESSARKLSTEALVTFPDANSRFPLYFGLAMGPGFFLKQVKTESVLSLDYSLLAGVRMQDVVDRIGFMVEAGLKDHLLVFSDGQFTGLYFNVGAVFAF